MIQKKFTITAREANLLDRVASATKMDDWFWIKEDPEGQGYLATDLDGLVDTPEEAICQLEDGLAYPLTEIQSGGFTPEEAQEVEAVFRRAKEQSKQTSSII